MFFELSRQTMAAQTFPRVAKSLVFWFFGFVARWIWGAGVGNRWQNRKTKDHPKNWRAANPRHGGRPSQNWRATNPQTGSQAAEKDYRANA